MLSLGMEAGTYFCAGQAPLPTIWCRLIDPQTFDAISFGGTVGVATTTQPMCENFLFVFKNRSNL